MSNQSRYVDYKNSGVEWMGEVPSHWEVASMRRFVSMINGGTPSPDEKYWGGEIPWATPVDLNSFDGKVIGKTLRTLTREGLQEGSNSVPANSVILSTRAPIGYAAITVHEVAFNQGCKGLVPRSARMTTAYLLYLLVACNAELWARGQGTTFLELSASALGSVHFCVPPLAEQQTIASYLDRETTEIDSFIADQRELIALLNERRAATITQAVTKGLDADVPMKHSGSEWFGDLPEHWTREKLSRLGMNHESGTSVNGYSDSGDLLGVRVLKTGCASKGYFDPSENKKVIEDDLDRVTCRVLPGALIVNRANTPDLVGSAAIAEGDYPELYLSDKLWQMNFARSSNRFFHWWTKTPVYKAQIRFHVVGASSSMQNLSLSDFKSFSIALPPRDEQESIIDYLDREVSEIDAAIGDAREAIELSKERRAALISAAVTGKIDVRDHTTAELGAA